MESLEMNMRKDLLLLAVILFASCGICLPQTGSLAGSKAATGNATTRRRVAATATSDSEDEIKQLKDVLAAFQQKTEQRLESLQQENAKLAEQLRQYQQKTDAAQLAAIQSQQVV